MSDKERDRAEIEAHLAEYIPAIVQTFVETLAEGTEIPRSQIVECLLVDSAARMTASEQLVGRTRMPFYYDKAGLLLRGEDLFARLLARYIEEGTRVLCTEPGKAR